jgi:hypothetical protein
LITSNHFPALLSSLHGIVSPLLSAASGYHSWFEETHNIPFQAIYYHLRLLDAYLLRQWGSFVTGDNDTEDDGQKKRRNAKKDNGEMLNEARQDWLVNGLIAVGVCAELRGGCTFFAYIH